MARKRARSSTGRTMRRKRTKRARRPPRPPLPLSGFPRVKLAKLRFVSEKTIDAGLSSFNYASFSANGAWDPDVALGGHQPTGFDQWMVAYNHYTVLGAKITVQPYHLTSGVVGYLSLALTSDSTLSLATNIDVLQSRLVSKRRLLTGTNQQLPKFSGLTKKFSAKKFFGIHNFVGKELYRGDATRNPTEQAYFHVIQSSPQGADAGIVNVLVTIDYIVAFSEPKDLNSS